MAESTISCTLQYPERFQAAVMYVDGLPQEVDLGEESKLLLYALQQQARVGPCNEPRPWGWNVVSNAKWQSWKQLGDMPAMEAMRLYVRTLEEEIPGWWTPEVAAAWDADQKAALANGGPHDPSAGTAMPNGETPTASSRSANASPAPAKSRSVAEVVVEGSWVSPYIASNRRPPPRYEHAVALIGNYLYVIGGNCGGRYLNDTWALNLENLTWTCVVGKSAAKSAAAKAIADQESEEGAETASLLPPAALPALAGHAAVSWNGNVLSIGGHCKVKDAISELPVRLLDTAAGAWSVLQPTVAGSHEDDESSSAHLQPPIPRGGHSATIIGSKVYLFGGEDSKRKPLAELWTLDLATLEWERPETSGTPPPPRSAHSAVSYRNRYIVIFGGGSVATCFNDLWILDTQTLEWVRPLAEGPVPPPRAGHAAAILGSTLYLVGGGNNAKGCADMYSLDLSPLETGHPVQWVLVGNTPADAAIASEGLSLLSVPMAGCMVSYGGYNGRYHNAVHVYRPEGFVILKPGQVHAAATAAAAAAGRSGGGGDASATASYSDNNTNGTGSGPGSVVDAKTGSRSGSVADLEAARREAAATKEAVALEVSIMRRQLDSATAALSTAERTVEEVREALAAEQQRSMQLEVEVAELRQRLVEMNEMERELTRYRQQQQADEGKKAGLWGYITGSDATAA